MASLAELMFQSASKATSESPIDFQGALKAGAQIAAQQEELQLKREQLEKAKKDAQDKSIGETIKVIQTALKFPNEADQRRFLKGAFPKAVQAYGTQEIFTPQMQDMLINSGESRNAMALIAEKVRNNEMSIDQAVTFMTEQGLGEAIEYKTLQDAQKFARENVLKKERAEIIAQAKVEAADTEFGRTAKKAALSKTGNLYAQWQDVGRGEAQKTLSIANEIINQLDTGELKTREWVNVIPFFNNPEALALLKPEQKAAMDRIRELVNLKSSLDSQFSRLEAEQKFKRIFDPTLGEKANQQKLKDFVKGIKLNIISKEDQFIKDGLMTEAERTIPKETSKPKAPPKEIKDAYFRMNDQSKKALAEKYNMTPEQLKKMMEAN